MGVCVAIDALIKKGLKHLRRSRQSPGRTASANVAIDALIKKGLKLSCLTTIARSLSRLMP